MQRHVTPSIRRTPNFARDAADLILEKGRQAIAQRGLFRLALAGGNTPRAVYEELASRPEGLPWEKVIITFGDERCVGPEHEASNYLMAFKSLLGKVPIPEGNVFRIRGEIDPQQAADEQEARLAAVASRMGEDRYAHDLVLLGLGEDGHTASLFPGSPSLEEQERNVIPTTGPKPPPQRVTFTYPLLNAARTVAFLVNDASKEPVIQAALAGEFPAGKVCPREELVWVIGQ